MVEVKTIPLHLGEWEEAVGHVESVTLGGDRLRIILSSIPQYALIEIPVPEAKFDPPRMGMNVGIIHANDRGKHFTNGEKALGLLQQ
jgi:hypothetical protein